LLGAHQVVVLSLKGGVGKTTVAALLALALADHRADRVAVLDAGPVGGTLADRLVDASDRSTGTDASDSAGNTDSTVRDLVEALPTIGSPSEVERFGGLVGRLRVFGSDQDVDRDTGLSGPDYQRICQLLRQHFNVVVTDAAPGPALRTALAMAHCLVVVGSQTVDGGGRASRTLDWLISEDYIDLAARSVLVLDGDRASQQVDAELVRGHFAARCRAVVELPADPHLAQGGRIDVTALDPATRDAALDLAALVADEFGAVAAGRG
jgi:MinD-like ATPase involved in chromosome partitioning or flagellar assembly